MSADALGPLKRGKVFGYAGFCACGCGAIRAGSVDLPELKDDTAKFVAELIRDGMRVERMPIEEIRMVFCECKNRNAGQLDLALPEPVPCEGCDGRGLPGCAGCRGTGVFTRGSKR